MIKKFKARKFRQLVPSIIVIFIAILFGYFFVFGVHEHVGKAPYSKQEELAFRIHQKRVACLSKVIEAMNKFIQEPAKESELGEEIINAHQRWCHEYDKWRTSPIVHVKIPNNSVLKETQNVVAQLEEGTARFNAELLKRANDPNFEIDKSLYRRLEDQLRK